MAYRSVTLVSPTKTAEPIKMLIWIEDSMGPGNRVLDGSADPTWKGVNFERGKGRPIVKYRDTLRSSPQR